MKLSHLIFPWICQKTTWPFANLYFRYFLRLRGRGREHFTRLPRSTRIIFAVNHSSLLDSILVTICAPYWSRFIPMYYVARAQKDYQVSSRVLQLFYGGLFFELWGALPTFPGNQDYEKSLETHIKLLERGKSIMIFPEGGIRRNGEVKEARGGVAFLAERTDALVVPVHVKGLYDLKKGEMRKRKRRAEIIFGEPIGIHTLGGDYKAKAEKILEVIYSL